MRQTPGPGPRLLLGATLAASLLAADPASPQAAAPPKDAFAIPANDDGLPGAGPIRRYDWFQKLWRERRGEWAREREQDRGAVVFLGDSITQGWGGGLGAAFPGVKVANRGISGDTTRGVLIRLQDDVLALDPPAVVLLIGTNDLEEGAAPETAAANLKLILAGLERHDPRLRVVLCLVFPSSAAKQRPADRIKALNALYLAAVKNDPRVVPLETWTLFADAGGDARPEEFPDLLHPNEAGYAKWAAALRPVLATLGLSETSAEPFTPEEGFESLFNGRDLTGWGYRPTSEADKASAARWQAADPNAAAWPIVTEAVRFDGLERSPDGRFAVIGGRLVVTTPPEYRKIQQLWTTREFPGDFVLKLEFRATPFADSGVYLRGPQLQCRDYRLAGPYKSLAGYRPQEWNELVVTVQGGVARATCNGELIEAEMKLPASGPIGVEGDRGQMEYRRIRVKRLAAPAQAAAPDAKAYAGRWNVRITDSSDTFVSGGFEFEQKQGALAGGLVWRWGSYLPAKTVEVKDGVLRLTREETPGKIDSFEARLEGDALVGQVTYPDGKVHHFTGRKAPLLLDRRAPVWGDPVALFDGKTLVGWKLRDAQKRNGWAAQGGELVVVEPKDNADLVTEQSFTDFKLHLEFNVDKHSNSGVYLRGRYEIQILDNAEAKSPLDVHACGALYSRVAPSLDAAKPAGEWQSYDISFVGRQLQVVLNGKTIVNTVVAGITGGALDPFEGEPGPIMLQGDHGKVRFRNIVVTPGK